MKTSTRKGTVVVVALVAVALAFGPAFPAQASVMSTINRAIQKIAGATTAKTTCTIGQVRGFTLLEKVKNKAQEGRLTLQYEKKTKQGKTTTSTLVTQPYKLSKKQYDVAVSRGVGIGRQAKICTKGALTGKTMATLGNVLNLAPAADPDDSSGGGAGGGGGGSGS